MRLRPPRSRSTDFGGGGRRARRDPRGEPCCCCCCVAGGSMASFDSAQGSPERSTGLRTCPSLFSESYIVFSAQAAHAQHHPDKRCVSFLIKTNALNLASCIFGRFPGGRFGAIFADSGRCGSISGRFLPIPGEFSLTPGDFGQFWGDSGRFWAILAHSGQFWPILGDFRPFSAIFARFRHFSVIFAHFR